MGPDNLSDMSLMKNNQALSLPKLWDDGSNWATYSKCILNYLISKGYCQHVQGTVCKLEVLNQHHGSFYRPSSLAPLSDDELQKHKEATDLYDQMQAAVQEIIYWTVDKTTFLQIKNEEDAASVWRKSYWFTLTKGAFMRQISWSNFRTLTITKKKAWENISVKWQSWGKGLLKWTHQFPMNPSSHTLNITFTCPLFPKPVYYTQYHSSANWEETYPWWCHLVPYWGSYISQDRG